MIRFTLSLSAPMIAGLQGLYYRDGTPGVMTTRALMRERLVTLGQSRSKNGHSFDEPRLTRRGIQVLKLAEADIDLI